MAFVQVDPNQIKMDAPGIAQPPAGFVSVDPLKLQMDAPGLFSRIGTDLSNRWDQAQANTHQVMADHSNGLGIAGGVAQGLGVVGGAINDAVSEVGKSAFGMLPAETQQMYKDMGNIVAKSPVGDAARAVSAKYGEFAKEYPNATNAAGALASFATSVPAAKGALSLAGTAGDVMKGAVNKTTPVINQFEAASKALPGILGDVSSGVEKPALFSPDMLEAGANLHYADAERIGANLKPQGFADTVSVIKQSVGPQDSVDIAFAGKSPVTDTLSRLDDIVKSGNPVTLKNLDNMDTRLNSDISVAMRAGDKQTASDLLGIKGMLKNSSKTVKPQDLVNPQAFDSWRQGDTLWSAKSKMQQLQGIVDNAYKTENPDSAMRSGYRALSKQLAKNPQGWTAEEISLVNKGAKQSLTAAALKTVGGKLMSGFGGAVGGGIAGVMMGGPLGAVVGGLAGSGVGEAIGWPMRVASNAMQESRAMAPFATVANRPSVLKAIPQSVSEVAKLPIAEQRLALEALFKARKATSVP